MEAVAGHGRELLRHGGGYAARPDRAFSRLVARAVIAVARRGVIALRSVRIEPPPEYATLLLFPWRIAVAGFEPWRNAVAVFGPPAGARDFRSFTTCRGAGQHDLRLRQAIGFDQGVERGGIRSGQPHAAMRGGLAEILLIQRAVN